MLYMLGFLEMGFIQLAATFKAFEIKKILQTKTNSISGQLLPPCRVFYCKQNWTFSKSVPTVFIRCNVGGTYNNLESVENVENRHA